SNLRHIGMGERRLVLRSGIVRLLRSRGSALGRQPLEGSPVLRVPCRFQRRRDGNRRCRPERKDCGYPHLSRFYRRVTRRCTSKNQSESATSTNPLVISTV